MTPHKIGIDWHFSFSHLGVQVTPHLSQDLVICSIHKFGISILILPILLRYPSGARHHSASGYSNLSNLQILTSSGLGWSDGGSQGPQWLMIISHSTCFPNKVSSWATRCQDMAACYGPTACHRHLPLPRGAWIRIWKNVKNVGLIWCEIWHVDFQSPVAAVAQCFFPNIPLVSFYHLNMRTNVHERQPRTDVNSWVLRFWFIDLGWGRPDDHAWALGSRP